jgi:hypothetical protein
MKNCADADPWNRLVEKFNNYKIYKYANMSVNGSQLSGVGLPVAVEGMEAICAKCHDINPSAPDRPIRDGLWLRTQYRDLRKSTRKRNIEEISSSIF